MGVNKVHYGLCESSEYAPLKIGRKLGRENGASPITMENKAKEMYYSMLSLKMISFVLFPQASQPSMNFNISKLVYCMAHFGVTMI